MADILSDAAQKYELKILKIIGQISLVEEAIKEKKDIQTVAKKNPKGFQQFTRKLLKAKKELNNAVGLLVEVDLTPGVK